MRKRNSINRSSQQMSESTGHEMSEFVSMREVRVAQLADRSFLQDYKVLPGKLMMYAYKYKYNISLAIDQNYSLVFNGSVSWGFFVIKCSITIIHVLIMILERNKAIIF